MQWRNWIQTCKTGDQMYSECSLVYLFKCQIVGLHWVGGTTLDPFIDLSGLELCLAIPDFTSLVSIHGSGYPGDPSSEDSWIIYLTSFLSNFINWHKVSKNVVGECTNGSKLFKVRSMNCEWSFLEEGFYLPNVKQMWLLSFFHCLCCNDIL